MLKMLQLCRDNHDDDGGGGGGHDDNSIHLFVFLMLP
jgi:hypothetical protein